MRRTLVVSLTQALKGVGLTLFPIIFISLFAWATAGSTSGNTADPMRAAAWFWTAAHLVPFKLLTTSNQIAGQLSLLPMGALIFPVWAIRKSFALVREVAPKESGGRLLYSVFYATVATGLSLASRSSGISSSWYLSSLFTFLIAFCATLDFSNFAHSSVKLGAYIFLAMWGVAAIATSLSLFSHWKLMVNLTTVNSPGIVGGVLLLFLQILYLPNAAFAALSYLVGAGFTLGLGTVVSPTHFTLTGIPAVPLLSAMPTGKHPLILLGFLSLLIFATLIYVFIRNQKSTFKGRSHESFRTFLILAAVLTGMAYFSSGELLTPVMAHTGTIWLVFGIYLLSAFAAVMVLFLYIPRLFSIVGSRG